MRSMTGFGSGQASGSPGSLVIEIRSVNSRYLDLQFKLPDELRQAEMPLRELISQHLSRGKVEIRANYTRAKTPSMQHYTATLLHHIESTYQHIKQHIPSVSAPTLTDITQWPDPDRQQADISLWTPLCVAATQIALTQLTEVSNREGQRLATIIAEQAQQMHSVVTDLRTRLPALLQAQHDRIATRLREAIMQAFPEGLAHISGQEISQRLATEASLLALKADVAEELDRLATHLKELDSIVSVAVQSKRANAKRMAVGKRLDFLFQEMNREANTLGSKSVNGDMTKAAMDLKLLIEQMREQIQNIE
ncbi:MAG: YicC/YloC family endoribonuclease [Orrella sp.]